MMLISSERVAWWCIPHVENAVFLLAQCGQSSTRVAMMNNLSIAIVAYDRQITESLCSTSANRASTLLDLWRLSGDPDAFAAALVARLLLEHQLRALATDGGVA